MNIIKKNLMDLALRNLLIGTKIFFIENNTEVFKIIEDFIEYDSITHTFKLKFTNGDIQEISDKVKFKFELPIEEIDKQSQKPNKNRIN